jgi:deoxyhypusine monooxygenase
MCKIEESTTTPESSGHTIESLKLTLLNEEEEIAKRTRSVFLLRQIGTIEAIDVLVQAMKSPSILLGHEVAFVLGQMQNSYVLPQLVAVMKSTDYHPIVRHEAAEAIGAIGNTEYIPLLEEYSKSDVIELAETCQIALDRLKFLKENPDWDQNYKSDYHCVDPAPPCEENDIEKIKATLIDQTLPLFERYRAMFKLRDLNTPAAISALTAGFNDTSALFRHEIAYVFGQLCNPLAESALITVMQNKDEHSMVRHEAAEALGSIADNDTVVGVLNNGLEDEDRIVKESCQVALDIYEYWLTDEIETAVDDNEEETKA